ncbi:MAG TPA: histidine phosphatase family protein [Glaciibacter sp.]|nr:histidine phosphatase family protein [Glaciibacter sp.]
MKLALIRHGQTDWNREFRLQGSSDIPLNDTGREQARQAVELLSTSEWDVIVSSPLGRARETAQIIADGLGLKLGPAYDLLIERDYGDAEGATEEVIAKRWPDREYPGLESVHSVGDRGARALEQIAADFGDARVIIVTHGTLIRVTLDKISGLTFPSISNAAISTVEKNGDSWRVLSVNGEPLEALAV